jgi:hypothetical protein
MGERTGKGIDVKDRGTEDGESVASNQEYALDENKKLAIIALLSNGGSRRAAARYVGCAPSTITRAAARDPDFAAKMDQAEQRVEIEALRCLRSAYTKGRYWRAAAWMLERKNPLDFAPYDPLMHERRRVKELFHNMVQLLADGLPDSYYDFLISSAHEVMRELECTNDNPARLALPQPEIDYQI